MYWQHSPIIHHLISQREHLEFAVTHCWDGSLKLAHSDMYLIRGARTAWQSTKKGLESLGGALLDWVYCVRIECPFTLDFSAGPGGHVLY